MDKIEASQSHANRSRQPSRFTMGGEKLKFTALDHLDRPCMNQDEFDKKFGSTQPLESPTHRFRRNIKRAFLSSCASKDALLSSILSFVPIASWLPNYDWRGDFLSDVIGGLTSGIMNIPQGISYSLLAGVAPVYGLYASCFPAFFYMLFGTSKHTSLGSFAVVALMAGIAREQVMDKFPGVSAIEAATTIAFSVGIWQIICGLLRLQFVLSYFSSPLVSGFSTGAAMHVFVTQIDDIMGIIVPNASGPGYLFTRFADLASLFSEINLATVVISAATFAFLLIGKEIVSPAINRHVKLRFPIPYELLAIIISTILSSIFNWSTTFGIYTVGDIPAGLPMPGLPNFEILPVCLLRSVSIAIVSIAVHVSMAKMLANQFGYKVDVHQELYALGLSSCLGATFPIYAVSTALGRTMVAVRSGTKTQFSALSSCALLVAVILWFGPLLTELPKCVLASIIVVALQSMFEKFSEPVKLWRISKYDSITWVIAFAATVFIDVMEGLAVALIFAVLTVVMRTQWPHWQYFVPVENKKNAKKNDIALFRFEGPLQFTNAERFQNGIRFTVSEWEMEITKPSLNRKLILDCSAMVYMDSVGVTMLNEVCTELQSQNIEVLFSGLNAEVRRVLSYSGLDKLMPVSHFFPTVGDAVGFANLAKIENMETAVTIEEAESNIKPHNL